MSNPSRPRVILTGAVLAVIGLLVPATLASASPTATAAGSARPKPTIVLVHGAWADASSGSAASDQSQEPPA